MALARAPADPELSAKSAELAALAAALEREGLPSADLEGPEKFFFAFDDAEAHPVGFGGLEIEGPHALLRSVIALERGKGSGRAIVEWLIDYARKHGVARLYLLTTTACAFFEHLGFMRIERNRVPPAIAATEEFRSLCPSSALCLALDMSKQQDRQP